MTITGTQTIHYVDQNGKQIAPDDTSQHVQFTHEIVIDKVTGQQIADHGWTNAQTYQKVTTPPVKGYTADKAVAGGETVTYQQPNSQNIVHFTPINDTQKATIIYVDTMVGDRLFTQRETGKSNTPINYSSADELANLTKQGYVLVNNGYDPNGKAPSFDNQTEIDQTYYILLTHGTKDASQDSTVKETIHYVYADGKKAHDDVTVQKHFTQKGTQDLVTKQIVWQPVASQQFDRVVSPTITGYVPDQGLIPAITVNYGDKNIERTVIYLQGEQTATIRYIDDTTGNTMMTDNTVGKFNDSIKFANNVNDQINGFEKQGYAFVSNSFKNQKFQADNTKNIFEVHFKHRMEKVSRQDPVTETINYVYADGRQAHKPKVASVEITQYGTKDLVTSQIDWLPADPQQFKAVTSPTIEGYVPDVSEVPAIAVDFGQGDVVRTVTYRSNQQQAQIIYVDDTTGDQLKTVDENGTSGDTIPYTSKADLDDFLHENYALVNNGYDPAGKTPKFDNDTSLNQIFYIHLNHNVKSIQRQNTITETVHYVYADGKKAHDDVIAQKHFVQNGTEDLVTTDVAWQPVASQQFNSVKSPTIAGYTPDYKLVPAFTVNFGDKDINTTVTYTAGKQTATIIYVDRTTGHILNTLTEHGTSATTIPYSSANDLKNYQNSGYVLDENKYDPNGAPKFNSDENIDQTFYIYLKHGTTAIKQPSVVYETIHYVYQDGTPATKNYTAKKSFTRQGVKDLVTNEIKWQAVDPQNFASVESPKITGYIPDQLNVPVITVNYNSDDVDRIVTYAPAILQATIKYIDDNTRAVLSTDDGSGKYQQPIEFANDVNTQIKNYEGQGYKLVSNNFSGQNYQMDNAKNVFEVHLKHGMKQISRNSTVHETITYVYTDGSRAAAPVTAEKDFTQMGTEDQVTKHITWQPVASEHFTSVKSPEISGYVPDIVEVPAIDVNFGHDDIFKKVTYESLNQRAKITYIDQTTNQALQIVDKNGNANTVIPYTSHNDLQRYLDKGYHLVTNGYDPDGKTPSFDNDKNVDQNFIITLEHTYQTINPKHPGKPGQPINKDPNGPKYPSNTDTQSLTTTGTLVVHYVGAGKQTPKDQTRHVTFTHEIVIDKVTGKKVADHGWMPASQTYDTIKTPIISGYTADKDVAGGQVVTQDNPNREETVYYTAIPAEQTAKITYIDDTTGKTLTSDNGKGGKAGDLIVFNHDVNNQIDNYVHQGYKLVSNNFRSQNYQTDNTKNQFEVHLSHDIKDLTQGSIVKEVIHYIYADKTTAAPDATAEVHFVQHGQQDQVTKEVKWAPVKAAEFAAVKSPVIDGYTADQAEIVAVPVHFGDQDTVKTVTYHAGDQKATITYIDRTTGKTLTIRTEVGKANSTIPYQSKADIIGYEDLGYVLDDNQYDAQGTPSFDDDNYIDQNFNIYLKHTYQTINPKHPGKPGQPINKDPNGPKYPSDTDAQSLTITGTQTIHYVDQNGNPVAPDDTSQHVQFTHEIVIDKVTGQRIADHGWTNAQTYQKVKVPTVKGYTADKTVAGGETVTYKRPDSIAYVHYTPIEQQRAQVIYVDQSTGDYLKTVTKTGAAMTTIPYQSKDDLKGYLDAGYVLIKNGYDPVGKAPSFDNQTATDQIFYITLNHNTKETSRQDVVTETIHYIYADGKKAHDDVTVQKHFTQKGTQDLVTKQISWQPVASQQFTSVASPAIDGYHADQPVIPAVIVNYGSPDIVKTVTYTAGDQQATIIYVDDTTGNELNRISENGKSGKQIPYSSKQDLLSYEEQGYVLVTNGYDVNGIPSFDKDENINQIFYINLKHGTQSVTPNNPGNPKEPNIPGKPQHPTDYDPATLEKDVTRTIKYVVNGNHQVPDSIKQTVHFEQKGLYDKVTGEWITPLSWVVDHQVVKGVISPRIAGYRVVSVSGDTTDNQNVNAKTLGPEDSSYIITVTYDSASPTNPTTPTSPTSSTTPTNPTSPTSPTTPTSPMAPTNPTSPTTPTAPTSPVDDTNQPKITPHFVNSNVVHKPTTRMVSQPIDLQQVTTTNQGANVLPQTGNEEVISAAAFGLMGLAMAASIVAGTRKKRHE